MKLISRIVILTFECHGRRWEFEVEPCPPPDDDWSYARDPVTGISLSGANERAACEALVERLTALELVRKNRETGA